MVCSCVKSSLLHFQGLLGSSDSNDGLSGRLESNLEEDGATDMLMVEEEMLEDSVVVETVEDVMEVDGLDLEDTGGCVQVRHGKRSLVLCLNDLQLHGVV